MLILCTDLIYIIIISLQEADDYVKMNSVCKTTHCMIKNNTFKYWGNFINPKCSKIPIMRNLLPLKNYYRLVTPLKDYHNSLSFLALGYLHHKLARNILRKEFNKIIPIINDVITTYFEEQDHKNWRKIQTLVYKNNTTTNDLIITICQLPPYLLYIAEILIFIASNILILEDLFKVHNQRVYNPYSCHKDLRNEIKRISRRLNYVTTLILNGQMYFGTNNLKTQLL